MGKFDNIKVGEKLPGTYCPVCGEVGLRKMKFGSVVWAMCPMDSEMNATVTKLKDTHTGYRLDGETIPTVDVVRTPEPEIEIEIEDEEGVDDA